MFVLFSRHLVQKPKTLIYAACQGTEDQHIFLRCRVISCRDLRHRFAKVCAVLVAVTQHFDAMQLIVRTNIVAQGIKVSMDDTGKLFGLSTWFLLRIRFAFLQNLLFGPQCHPQTCRATCLRHHRHICETGYVSITART